ncbi:YkgJ family cysteine cluster protein [Methanocella arvoryzae]|uniref:Fe-S-cluster oxidoreductase n=1 Tax=Methanocella arvoryzae (strain DSM 22066 / NBRC 105507 / MRE50) TaxID=351160 RepID=Q0W125_METAR|nr:YkgJ family cysteine cluster protein [Methanocella arvoryzae]CAJ37918.1 hypothetical protein RRC161 [Methanocella arvoryzae MRE50]
MMVNGLPVVKGSDLACAGCGTCCTVYGLVDLHVTDIFRISEFLGLTPEQFFDRYTYLAEDKDGNWAFSLDINGGCRFRIDDRCSIYPVRPDTCALYPFNYICVNLSGTTKKEIAQYPQCFVHNLEENMLVVPDIERTIDSRIMFMVKETYMAGFDGTFREEEARPFHEKGLMLVKNPRMRDMMYRKLLKEMMLKVPVNEDTMEPALSEQDIKAICDHVRGI